MGIEEKDYVHDSFRKEARCPSAIKSNRGGPGPGPQEMVEGELYCLKILTQIFSV